MCNNYRYKQRLAEGLDGFDISTVTDSEHTPETDLWPRRHGYVVRDASGERVMDVMQWGVPLTMKGKRPGTTRTNYITNVRNLASPFWRGMLTKPAQRCLVPFNRFAEPKPGGGQYWFAVPSRPVAAFAGIWRESDAGRVFAFLTCAPNALVAPLRPKPMPVILHESDYGAWLAGADARELATPFPSQLMALVND